MKVTVNNSISDIPQDQWNELAGETCPFLQHQFLNQAEQTNCVSSASGWSPRHLTIYEHTALRAAMPLYEKSHSWGEFVFDSAWANAYQQTGLSYYPKLVSALPFTPVPSRRLLLRDPNDAEAAAALLQAALSLARQSNCSSLHILFPTAEEIPWLEEAGLLIRKDCQFHWHNHNYRNFDDFLTTFTAAKRKKVRRDRRRVAEDGITFRRISGTDADRATWALVYRLISTTFKIRGSMPYFNESFFVHIAEQIPDSILIVLAEIGSQAIAAAVFFENKDCLYGRYWGADGRYNSLHFETCYYQGIDYCIESGKKYFEPGTQGEHKVSRGFIPVSTWSAHWLAHPQFSAAIGKYLDAEGKHVDRYMHAIDAHTPYKTRAQDS